MNDHVNMMVRYQHLLKMSQSMLSLAVAGNWDDLIDCEMKYLQSVEQVTHKKLPETLPRGLQGQIQSAIKQILDNESQLKSLLNGRMDELRGLVESSTHQRNISSTYGKMSNTILFPAKL
ncbi:flagella biosynthesis regulatory protein FliT [Erwinia billingiae]|uniref:flagella biosynthesis regulatory protein FliT n=1 Tax=Erwinia billingiae TaxID=182337 RepID=UPI000CFE8D19|nr:flagella biosynthesis regulatory protein FliT [Erwinia billingiae]PRB60360.1 flagella biosynthesis regulatory protein FliT [Erwinia billingiae]